MRQNYDFDRRERDKAKQAKKAAKAEDKAAAKRQVPEGEADAPLDPPASPDSPQ